MYDYWLAIKVRETFLDIAIRKENIKIVLPHFQYSLVLHKTVSNIFYRARMIVLLNMVRTKRSKAISQ